MRPRAYRCASDHDQGPRSTLDQDPLGGGGLADMGGELGDDAPLLGRLCGTPVELAELAVRPD